MDVNECRQRGIQALIAVPVYHDGGVAGALELYFNAASGFREADVHSCQLMAGLVTEALARDEELTWKKSLAEERSVMLDALEKIKPNLAALAGEGQTNLPAVSHDAAAEGLVCGNCGANLVAGEQYCGGCGSPQAPRDQAGSLQSKLGSFLNALPAEKARAGSSQPLLPQEDPFAATANPGTSVAFVNKSGSPADEVAQHDSEDEDVRAKESAKAAVPETENDTATWTSAAKARDFLEQVAEGKNESALGRFWSARRGDVYLAVAVILVAIVIRWGIWSEGSVSATGTPTTMASSQHAQPDPEAGLSVFDKMLISLGLADPPEAPEDRGNPDTQVWVDLHTALYYCPGTDLYGKTPKGRYATQRDAQLDQFEPAYRKTCN